MGYVKIEVNISNLAPVASREVIHTVEGTLVRAEILEADSRHFKARILEPFERVIEKSVPVVALMVTDFTFVRDGRLTTFFVQAIHQEMERSLHEWSRLEQEKQHLFANRASLEPLTLQTHGEAQKVIASLEDVVKAMQALGETLNSEFVRLQRELRKRFKSGVIDQTEFQTKLKALKKGWPERKAGDSVMAEVDELNQRFRTQRALLVETQDAFCDRAGIGLAHAASLMGLEKLPLAEGLWRYPSSRLQGLNWHVSSLFRVGS